MAETEILAEVDLTTEDGEDVANYYPPLAQFGGNLATVAGLVAGAQMSPTATEPTIVDGLLTIPAGEISSTETADTAEGRKGVVGGVSSANAWEIVDGEIHIGLANSGNAGVLANAEIAKLSAKTPVISAGLLQIPLAQAGEHPTSTTADTPGAISGIEYVEGTCLGIVDGIIHIPKPSEELYTFDSAWFTVTDGEVSLNEAALASVVNELADEMSVEVTGSGVLEETYAGTLKANTSGTLTLNTLVTY